MTDPVADMLTRIRNGIKAGHDRVEVPASKMKAVSVKFLKKKVTSSLLKLLQNLNLISDLKLSLKKTQSKV